MDPSNREVLAELKRLESRQHLKRGSLVAAAVAALGAGAFFILNRASERAGPPAAAGHPAASGAPAGTRPARPAAGPAPAATQPCRPPAASPPAMGLPQRRPRPRRNAAGSRRGARRPRAAVEKRTFMLAPLPPRRRHLPSTASVWAAFGPGPTRIELDWSRDHIVDVQERLLLRRGSCEVGPDQARRAGTTGSPCAARACRRG